MRQHPGEAFGYQHIYEPPPAADATSVGQGPFLAEVACMKRRLHADSGS